MSRYTSRLLGAAGAVAAAGAIAVSGLTAASARPAASGTEHFQLMSASLNGNTESIVATGLFTAGGVDHEGKGNTGRVVFPGGTFKIRHSAGKGPQRFNPKTCLLTISQTGTYKLIDGTGKFAGISGHGRYRLTILAVASRVKGKCSMSKAPAAAQVLIRASGPAHK
jgi:hypothetical protein